MSYPRIVLSAWVFLFLTGGVVNSGSTGGEVDPQLASFVKLQEVSGVIKCVGSDTMHDVLVRWGDGFRAQNPAASMTIVSQGSSTAVPALITGESMFGAMSRKVRDTEVAEFRKQFGYTPVQLRTSVDMLAVYVHEDNPVKGLTMAQVDAIFSRTRRGGYPTGIVTWGDLGLTGEWAEKPIVLYGRDSASGTNEFFRQHALFGGQYKESIEEVSGGHLVVGDIANNRYAIGYSGIGYAEPGVRAVPLSVDTGDDAVFMAAVARNAHSGQYPMSRYLYLTVNIRPALRLDGLRREFLRYVFSREGQQDVVAAGYLPIPSTVCDRELRVLGIEPNF